MKIGIVYYADDTTPYDRNSKLENILKLLEETADKLFNWFSNNYLKSNSGKCHLFVNRNEDIRISVRNERIGISSNQ